MIEVEQLGAMICIRVDRKLADQLAVIGGEPPEKMHITLAYLGEAKSDEDDNVIAEVLTEVAAKHPKLKATLSGIGRFEDCESGDDAVVALVDAPGLAELRADLVEALEAKGIEVSRKHDFTPHITIAYIGFHEQMPVSRVGELDMRIGAVEYVVGDQRVMRTPLTGQKVEKATATSADLSDAGKENPASMTEKVIRERDGQWCVFGEESNRNFGCYDTKEEAEDRLRQLHSFSDKVQKGDGHVPPKGVREAAQRGLDLRDEYNRGGTDTGIARARDLSNGKAVSDETIRRMVAFFDRHEKNKDTPPEEGNGKIAWLLWGGDPGRAWANKVLRQIEGDKVQKSVEVSVKFPVTKAEEERRLVYGIVLEPDEVDAHNDTIDAMGIEKTAHSFLAKYNRGTEMGHQHQRLGAIGVDLVESYIAPMDFTLGSESVKKGSWIIAVKIHDDQIWSDVKSGKLTGFSIAGVATILNS